MDEKDSFKHAVIAEMIMVITAATTVFARGFWGKMVSWLILSSMIFGVAAFMYAGIDNSITSKSDGVESLRTSRELILQSINDIKTIMDDHSKNALTRRTNLQQKMIEERGKLDSIDRDIAAQKEVRSSNQSMIIGYASLLRIITMIVNTYLIHMLMLIMQRIFPSSRHRPHH